MIMFFFWSTSNGQEAIQLDLKSTVLRAWEHSNQAKLSEEKVNQADRRLHISKTKQYPDFGISGQYLYLTKPKLNLKFNPNINSDSEGGENNTEGLPEPHQLAVGQANLSLPLYSGSKIKNSIKANENQYKAAQYAEKSDQEDLAIKAIKDYVALYKARKTVDLVKENLKSAQRRVSDFSNLEKNELLPLNDLLKAKLHRSNVELNLDKATKNARILNYRLAVFLQLPEDTKIAVDTLSFGLMKRELPEETETSRADIKALQQREEAAENTVKVKKGDYFPAIALTAGYLATDIQHTLSITRAYNVGVGISYNLSDIFKNKSKVKLAKSEARSIELKLNNSKDQMLIDIKDAREEYKLALHNYEVYKKSKKQAEENYRIVKDKFDNGLLETRDLLEADTQRLQSEINLTTGKAEITAKYFELKRAQGKLSGEFSN